MPAKARGVLSLAPPGSTQTSLYPAAFPVEHVQRKRRDVSSHPLPVFSLVVHATIIRGTAFRLIWRFSGHDGVLEDCHPDIRSILDYWRSIHPEDDLPGRQHLRPQDIKHVLTRVSLIDVVDNPSRFRLRLIGTGIANFPNCDCTGEWLDDCYPGFKESACSNDFSKLLATGRLV